MKLSRKELWNKLPARVRRGLGSLLAVVPLDFMLGRRFRRARDWLAAAQWWSAEQNRSYQVEQLRRICRLAQARSPFYRDLFARAEFDPEQIREPGDLQALPTIRKHDVNANVERMLTCDRGASKSDYTTTGGTSGEPLRFYIDTNRSAIEYTYLVTSWERAGYRLQMPLAVLRGRVVQPDGLGVRHEHDPLLRHHYFSNFHSSDADLEQYVERIRALGPCFLHVYPSSAVRLARYFRASSTRPPENVCGLLAESEIVYPEQRTLVESVFDRRLFSCYGHTEKLVLGAGCEHTNAYHVWPTYGYCELLDEAGELIRTPGRRGEIVGTGFINTVMPFIRYRTGDFATFAGDQCAACGRKHLLLTDIEGHRTQEYLIASDGSEISWTSLNMHDNTFDRVQQFQFVQEVPGRATLRVVLAPGFNDSDRQRIHGNLGRKFDGRLTFEIEPVESIPLSPRGKSIYVDQRSADAGRAAVRV
jgi:phenylacetate-CoA ligase